MLAACRRKPTASNLDALDETVLRLRGKGRRVRFLYLVPNFQNPTGLLIGLEKRRRCSSGPSAPTSSSSKTTRTATLYFPDSATAEETRPIKADDRDGPCALSVELLEDAGAGVPVGWIVASRELVAKIELAKQAADLVHRRARSAI